MKSVQLGEITINWPQGYRDLSFDDRLMVAKLATGLSAVKAGPRSVLVWREIFCVFCRSAFDKGRAFRKWWNRLQLSFDQYEELRGLTAWVTEKPIDQPFESFIHNGVKYVVVGERFRNVSAAEWTEGIMDFIGLNGGGETLDTLIANFCRPEREDLPLWRKSEKYNGDAREPYNRQRVEEQAKDLADLDAGVKIQFLWWYEHLINEFFEEFEPLFRGASGEGPRYPDGRGYLMLLKNVAEKGHLGNFEAVTSTDVMLVYAILLDDLYNAEEQERRLKTKS